MRGTRTAHGRWLSGLGIIPAYAGNTLARNTMRPIRRDHPRVCGEHGNRRPREVSVWGSSPRMRGTPFDGSGGNGRPGIIPAYAGNTYRSAGSLPYPWDHPRVCGEHLIDTEDTRNAQGSSPRMWGTRDEGHDIKLRVGIIPAYAGNTVGVCRVILRYKGSSPRMRGTHMPTFARPDELGIIPAYAGNTMVAGRHSTPSRDHPRVCGEHEAGNSDITATLGSSPRMRGTRMVGGGHITPPWDHPRVCGEHLTLAGMKVVMQGSSPRMRGTTAWPPTP